MHYHDLMGVLFVLYGSEKVVVALDWEKEGHPILDAWRLPVTIPNPQGICVAGCGSDAVLFLAMDNDGLPPHLAAFRFPALVDRCSQIVDAPIPPPDL